MPIKTIIELGPSCMLKISAKDNGELGLSPVEELMNGKGRDCAGDLLVVRSSRDHLK